MKIVLEVEAKDLIEGLKLMLHTRQLSLSPEGEASLLKELEGFKPQHLGVDQSPSIFNPYYPVVIKNDKPLFPYSPVEPYTPNYPQSPFWYTTSSKDLPPPVTTGYTTSTVEVDPAKVAQSSNTISIAPRKKIK